MFSDFLTALDNALEQRESNTKFEDIYSKNLHNLLTRIDSEKRNEIYEHHLKLALMDISKLQTSLSSSLTSTPLPSSSPREPFSPPVTPATPGPSSTPVSLSSPALKSLVSIRNNLEKVLNDSYPFTPCPSCHRPYYYNPKKKISVKDGKEIISLLWPLPRPDPTLNPSSSSSSSSSSLPLSPALTSEIIPVCTCGGAYKHPYHQLIPSLSGVSQPPAIPSSILPSSLNLLPSNHVFQTNLTDIIKKLNKKIEIFEEENLIKKKELEELHLKLSEFEKKKQIFDKENQKIHFSDEETSILRASFNDLLERQVVLEEELRRYREKEQQTLRDIEGVDDEEGL